MDQEEDEDGKTGCCRQCCHGCRKHVLSTLLFLATVGGIVVGVVLRNVSPFDNPKLASRELMYLYFPWELLMRLMMFLVIPLIVSGLVTGIGALSCRAAGRITGRAALYYVVTTLLAVGEGFALVFAIKPGSRGLPLDGNITTDVISDNARNVNSIDTILDVLR